MNKAILSIFSGLSAVGKSMLAMSVVKHFGAVYLCIDTIEQGLKDLCRINVEGEGYQLAYRMAVNPSLTGKIIFHKFSGCFV